MFYILKKGKPDGYGASPAPTGGSASIPLAKIVLRTI